MSSQRFKDAQQVIPGGVNSPVRSFSSMIGDPIFIERASESRIYDHDGNAYIDYVNSWGPTITGHADPDIIHAIEQQLGKGLTYGAPTQLETELATTICELIPSIDLVRMVNSGTEATMSAIRLARGATRRDKIIKFEGCYHGHVDSLLIKAGSGALTLGSPTSPGIPRSLAEETIVLPYNNSKLVKQAFAEWGNDIAAIIVEPIAGNMNCIAPSHDFLHTLRRCCDEHNSVLIFDEVMTGFRVALGGAQAHYGITPDLTTLGKVIGGGLPVGAFGGKRAIMEHIAPLGDVYQAGTLSGNPLAMCAGQTMLNKISNDTGLYTRLEEKARYLCNGLRAIADELSIPFSTRVVGSMFGFFFGAKTAPNNFDEVMQCNIEQFKTFHHNMITQGVYLAPSAFEAGFINTTLTQDDINITLNAARIAMTELTNI
ncbi:MAG: glutamate-1-semialdehyde 2,1-aminomutase [Pseudomonadota bacterium]